MNIEDNKYILIDLSKSVDITVWRLTPPSRPLLTIHKRYQVRKISLSADEGEAPSFVETISTKFMHHSRLMRAKLLLLLKLYWQTWCYFLLYGFPNFGFVAFMRVPASCIASLVSVETWTAVWRPVPKICIHICIWVWLKRKPAPRTHGPGRFHPDGFHPWHHGWDL